MITKVPPMQTGCSRQVKFMPSDINRLADLILSTDRSNLRIVTLELLFNFVALTEETLFRLVFERVQISERNDTFARQLRRYAKDGLVAPLSHDTLKKAVRAGMPEPENSRLCAYRLGPVGEEYARRKGWGDSAPISSPAEEYLAHDLICAEAMLRMQALWPYASNPGMADVLGPRQVGVWDTEKKAYLISPDGLLIKRSTDGGFVRAFVVEFHNNKARLQVQQKLKKYEEIFSSSPWIWEDYWDIPEMPWILVLHRQKATVERYKEEMDARADLNARFASTSLEDIWAGNLSIAPIR